MYFYTEMIFSWHKIFPLLNLLSINLDFDIPLYVAYNVLN